MNKLYCGVLSILSVACSYDASAMCRLYLRGDLGISSSEHIKNKQDFYIESGRKNFRKGVASSAGLGYKINRHLRAELSYNRVDNLQYRSNVPIVNAAGIFSAKHKQNLRLQAVMANLYLDVPLKYKLTPYLGVGFGYSDIRPGKASRSSATLGTTRSYEARGSNSFSYAMMAGIVFNTSKQLELDIGYRFQDFGKSKGFTSASLSNRARTVPFSIPAMSGPRIQTHSVMAGIRYSF